MNRSLERRLAKLEEGHEPDAWFMHLTAEELRAELNRDFDEIVARYESAEACRASLEADWVPDDARKGMHEFIEAAIERRWPGKGMHVKALLRESDRAS